MRTMIRCGVRQNSLSSSTGDAGNSGESHYQIAGNSGESRYQIATFSLATASGEQRVVLGIDEQCRLTARLYKETATGLALEPGSQHSVLVRVHSDADDSAGFANIRIAPTREALKHARVLP